MYSFKQISTETSFKWQNNTRNERNAMWNTTEHIPNAIDGFLISAKSLKKYDYNIYWPEYRVFANYAKSVADYILLVLENQQRIFQLYYRMFPPAIDIIPTSLAVAYSIGKYTNQKLMSHHLTYSPIPHQFPLSAGHHCWRPAGVSLKLRSLNTP